MICVDVIVPCYRYGHFLDQCVRSVLAQQGVNVRILIIDDCSPDDSGEVAQALSFQFPQVSFVRHAVNRGHIATYNEGIEWLSSPYYLLLSADDYLLPGALRRSSEVLDAHPEVGLAFGQQVALHENQTLEFVSAEDVPYDWQLIRGLDFIRASGARNGVPTPCAVVRTELQRRIGGYRPDLPHSGDMEMWMRIAARADVAVSQAPHGVYRRHVTNMSLAYTIQHWMPDIRQRKAAIDALLSFDTLCPQTAQELHQAALRKLAIEAIGFASSAFNENDLDVSRQLSDFALETSPSIRWAKARMKLGCKRCLGPTMWHHWQANWSRLRQFSAADQG